MDTILESRSVADKASHWQIRAACGRASVQTMFPTAPEGMSSLERSVEEIRVIGKYCLACPVTEECLTEALADTEQEGIRGGHTARERETLLKPDSAAKRHKRHQRPRSELSERTRSRSVPDFPKQPYAYYRPLDFHTAPMLPEATGELGHRLIETLNVLSQGFQLDEWGPFRYHHWSVHNTARQALTDRLGIGGAAKTLAAQDAALVNAAIERHILPIKLEDSADYAFGAMNTAILLEASKGIHAWDIAQTVNLSTTTIYNRLKKFQAAFDTRNLAHSVRRAYELGILTRPALNQIPQVVPLKGSSPDYAVVSPSQAAHEQREAKGNLQLLL